MVDFQELRAQVRREDFDLKADYNVTKRGMGAVVYYITTQDDPSVGIFGERVSPYFRRVSAADKWWMKNEKRLFKKYVG